MGKLSELRLMFECINEDVQLVHHMKEGSWLWLYATSVGAYLRAIQCTIFGHDMEYEDVGDADYGPKIDAWCKRCCK